MQMQTTPVGDLYLAASKQGLAVVSWQPMALMQAAAPLQLVQKQLHQYFNKQRQEFDLEIDLSAGTPFQQRVWRALVQIPYRTTISYAELARRVGSSPRAVGGAVGKNPLPIIVPCHRVVGANGALTGYSGGQGLITKKILLALEGIALPV